MKQGYRLGLAETAVPPSCRTGSPKDLGTKILVPGSWYQALGTKIYGEPERRSLSVRRGARGAAGPPPGGLGGWKPPRNSRGSGGRQPPSKNNFMDPEPPSDHLQPPSDHLQPPSDYFQPPSDHLPTITIFRGKGETHSPPLGQGFRTAWLITGQKFP